MAGSFRMVGLFAGIGGIEQGFRRAFGPDHETVMLCEAWAPAMRVLDTQFPGVDIHPDVRTLRDLPAGLDLVAAGFPCTDLSQAGRTAGIGGAQSGLVAHVFDALRLTAKQRRPLPSLLIENVPNMLALDRGKAMAYLVEELEALGYLWAYRTVDTRFTGLPQRRRRVLLLASRTLDPRDVLFSEDAGGLDESGLCKDAFGFYWTEGRGGLGWAQDATPTFKGSSTVGIPSPPAIWVASEELGRRIVTPSIEDGEQLQGFDRGWTATAAEDQRRNGPRWKLVGNAVSVDVSEWLAERIKEPGAQEFNADVWVGPGAWPAAAWGENGVVWKVRVSEFPRLNPYRHLLDVIRLNEARPLSWRASNGFWNRLQEGNLGRYPGFRRDIAEHVDVMAGTPAQLVA